MKTGNTGRLLGRRLNPRRASMEPGHEDREYVGHDVVQLISHLASMEPGHEDREYVSPSV